jgi:PKD repeat protein
MRAKVSSRIIGGLSLLVAISTVSDLTVTESRGGTVIEYEASDTLTPLEMDHGDTLKFRLRSGDVRTLVLEDTSAKILEKNEGGIVYMFTCRVRFDGHPLEMVRYVCSQECFYEPYVINGMRIWPDSVLAIYDKVPMRYPRTGNLRYRTRKAARFAVQDAALPICPEPMYPWYRNDEEFIDVSDCYNGDDCWMGPYLGQACHGGLDINHRRGEPLWAPIRFDDHWNFNSLADGHNNNRWRGIRTWPTGDVWALQSHHHVRLLVPERTSLPAGTHYAEAAGVHVGSHEHTHFEFKIARQGAGKSVDFDSIEETNPPEVIHLDPWIVHWQIFETAKDRKGLMRAAMKPLGPATTGRSVAFEAIGFARFGRAKDVECSWTFGDGGWSNERAPGHVYARPGLYPVTLTLDDGTGRDQTTQWLTVDGEPIRKPALVLAAPDEPSFHKRPVSALDVYNAPSRLVPHTLTFTARRSRPRPNPRVVEIRNVGAGVLRPASVKVLGDAGWLATEAVTAAERQSVRVEVDADSLGPATYTALVEVACPGALNSPQRFRVTLAVYGVPPPAGAIVDERSAGFYCTPYFWVGHQFCRCKRRGYDGRYLTNGGRAASDQFGRFTPDLAAGTYTVLLAEQTPFREDVTFDVRVRSAAGDEVMTVRPTRSNIIGAFRFHEGTDGFVEINAANSTGLVIADAVEFARVRP